MIKEIKNVEYIVWLEKNNKKEGRKIHVVGFVINETKNSIIISLTKSYGRYLDRQKILKINIISRIRID